MSRPSPVLRARLREFEALAAGEPVPSPCINVCRIEPGSGLCEGCRRTIEEIMDWRTLSDDGKREVWARLAHRVKEQA
ncbi:MAG TPA: DUF1289 domain-containing protein [Ramlibacter sp.]|nr:DUF1289 domain-containing protein [Ramlibacter sp.]